MANTKIKRPVRNGVAKVPMIMQMEALECGAASLDMILAYYGLWLPLEKVRLDCGVSRDGSNAANVYRAAQNYGLNVSAYRFSVEQIKTECAYPCIIHWNFNHFVVLCGFKGDRAVLCDPGRGQVTVSAEEFDESFTGVCLCFEPGESFTPGGKRKSVLGFAKKRLRGTLPAVALVVTVFIINAVINIIQPAFARVFMDKLLTGTTEWLYPFIMLMSGVALMQIVVAAVNAGRRLKLEGKLAITANSSYLWHVLRLPMEFFSQRSPGDIAMRMSLNQSIASVLINTAAPLVLDFALLIFYLTVMLRYSVMLTAIGLFSIALNLFVAQVISAKRVNITRAQMRDVANLTSTTAAGISMIETLKASGAESGFFEKWAGYQAAVQHQNARGQNLNLFLGSVPAFISSLCSMIILLCGVYLAMSGKFTVGMILAFQSLMTSFSTPAEELISAGQVLTEMRTDMERIEDVMEYPVQVDYSEKISEGEEFTKLSGKVELRNVTFGYSRLAPPLIENFSMTLEAGNSVAFVGPSGCGKSTLSKLISGLYKPWSGEILFDGKPISEIRREVFTGSLSVVDQNIILFEDSLRDNIKMWDSSIEDFEMILAARDAQIHDDIMRRDGGYDSVVTSGGRDLSGGQRQRMEIARVLAQDPTVVILDEATSALDAKTEYDVIRAINDRGISCIVVAHRLSTIRDCEEIIVLEKGKVVQRGTHDELCNEDGLYRQLVSNE